MTSLSAAEPTSPSGRWRGRAPRPIAPSRRRHGETPVPPSPVERRPPCDDRRRGAARETAGGFIGQLEGRGPACATDLHRRVPPWLV